MTRWLCAAAVLAGCASAPRPTVAPVGRPPVGAPDCAGFDAWLASLDARTSPSALGLSLGRGAGELTIAGEPAADERVRGVERVTCVDDGAAALVRTDCGNATLIGFAWDGDRWSATGRLAVIDIARPGRCVQSDVVARTVPLTAAEPREIAVESEATSDDGDAAHGRALRVARLGPAGRIAWYGGQVALGSFDEASGAETQGRWDIIEELPLPRDLYVEQRPLHGGLGGEPIAGEIRRETWRLRDAHLVRVDVVHERVVPAPPRN